jgi:hypothetical protein
MDPPVDPGGAICVRHGINQLFIYGYLSAAAWRLPSKKGSIPAQENRKQH